MASADKIHLMNMLDILIAVIFILSIVVGIWRGFFKEAISILTWGLAIWIAIRFSVPLSTLFPADFESFEFALGEAKTTISNFHVGIAMVLLFILTLILGVLVQYLAHRLITWTYLQNVDRTLGAAFGLLRGYFLVLALVIVVGLTAMNRLSMWQESILLPTFEKHARVAVSILPERYVGFFTP